MNVLHGERRRPLGEQRADRVNNDNSYFAMALRMP